MKLTRTSLQSAVEAGVLEQATANALWSFLEDSKLGKPRFDLIHILYYAGALLVIGAMGWWMTDAWERFGGTGIFAIAVTYAALFLTGGIYLRRYDRLSTPAGLLVTLAVCMTPLAVYGLQRALGIWGFDDPGGYKDFHRWIRGGWFAMEVATLIAAVIALRFFRFPFLTAPIAVTLWYISMDIAPIIANTESPLTWELRKQVSLWFGLLMLALAYGVDLRFRRDFAFWLYLFGLMAFWGGLSLMKSDSEFAKFGYFVINFGLIGISLFLHRPVFLIFGAMGVAGYIGHLAFRVFGDSVLFPFALSAIGIAVLLFGIWFSRLRSSGRDPFERLAGTSFARLRPPAK